MIYIDEIKNLRIYNKPFLLPINRKDKKKGSSVMLLTPNIDSSIKLMNHKLLINRHHNAYYLEKDVSFYINNRNILEHYDHSKYEYVHETDEGSVLNESKYNKNFKIIFNGYIDDVEQARRYISTDKLDKYMSDFKIVDIESPLSINVYKNTNRMDKDRTEGIKLLSNRSFDNSIDYELYCNGVLVWYLVNHLNPDCYSVIADAVVMIYSGYYDTYKDDIKEEDLGLYKWCRFLQDISKERNGHSKIVRIIKTNDLTNVADKSIISVLSEEAMNPISKLKRNITFSSRKGSAHIINKIVKSIEDLNDNPDVEIVNTSDEKEDEENADTEVKDSENNEESVEETYILENLYEDYELNESVLRTKRNITYLRGKRDKASPILKKLLYRERLRNNKEVLKMYKKIKSETPAITKTYLNHARYKRFNLFVDLSYYNRLFFENNMYKLDRGVNLYFELLSRFVNDSRLKDAGYNNSTVFIPIHDWDINPNTKMWMYNIDINPISVLYRLMRTNLKLLQDTFGGLDFVFITDGHYFKIDFNEITNADLGKFLYLFRSLRSKDRTVISKEVIDSNKDTKKDSSRSIVDTIVDDIETNRRVKISHLTGEPPKRNVNNSTVSKAVKAGIGSIDDIKTLKKIDTKDDKPVTTDKQVVPVVKSSPKKTDIAKMSRSDEDKKQIIDTIEKTAEISDDIETALDLLDKDEEFKKMILALSSEEINGSVVNNARASRISKLNDELLDKEVQGKSIRDIIEKKDSFNTTKLNETSLPVDSINPEWQELTYMNMVHQYDPDADIVAMLVEFANKSYPISIREIKVEDTSTSEDYINTYIVSMEAHTGKRFTLKFDVPKIVDNYYMMLRGNRKTISSQSLLMPILKTENDTVQIVSNYNKILIDRFGTTRGKSLQICDTIIKTLEKGKFKNIKVTYGDNSRICTRYDLPIDYIDLASIYNKIETSYSILYFNQSELREEFKDKIDYSEGLPIGVRKEDNTILYFRNSDPDTGNDTLSYQLFYDIFLLDDEFLEVQKTVNPSVRYTYSKASILNTKIPIIVLAAYSEGLIPVLNKAGVKFEISEKRLVNRRDKVRDTIKFNDGFLTYVVDYNSSLLMNGLKECHTEMYSLSDINNKSMYLDFLDIFGGKIKSDGIDNFYDLMIDPITKDVLSHYGLPSDYIELLLHANRLLADNVYIKHGDMTGRRIRRNELIAGYAYKVLSSAYGSYSTQLRRGRDSVMSLKQTAIIDAILKDPTAEDLSIINIVHEMESYNNVTTKGLSGMNSSGSYSLDKRSYDDSMLNVLSLSTGAAENVGISRQATLNANVDTVRGYINPSTEEDMNSINTLCMTEALTPFGTTRDDPFRSAMNFVQTSKHNIRSNKSDPLLVTNGADEALPYMVSNIFAHKAKDRGIVKEITEDYMIVEYDGNVFEYINLEEKVEKNSSSGSYVTLKLDTDLKEGNKIKRGQILAYDKSSFDASVGPSDNIAYRIGTLVKCALIDNDEGFEDSAIITDALSEAMTSDVVVAKQLNIPKSTNIYNMMHVGQAIEEGDTLMVMQSSFDEEDANNLLKNLAADEEDISDLGRIKIRSKVTGVVQDIAIYRTVELDELSESLQKLCNKYESNIRKKKNIMKKYNIDSRSSGLPADYKLDPVGKLKGAVDGISIIFYLKYEDKMSVGDKLIYWSAQKGIIKHIIPKGKEPYTLSRPDEKLHTLVSLSATNGRKVTSIQNIGILNRLLIEASRKIKDMAGIPYDINLL